MKTWDYHPHLEVIARDGEHADSYIVSVLMARGLVVEKRGRLRLTRSGKAELTMTNHGA